MKVILKAISGKREGITFGAIQLDGVEPLK